MTIDLHGARAVQHTLDNMVSPVAHRAVGCLEVNLPFPMTGTIDLMAVVWNVRTMDTRGRTVVERLEMQQRDLARAVGVSRQGLSSIEAGETVLAVTLSPLERERKAMRKMIGFALIAMLATACGCSDHHPDVWFDAGSDAKTGDAGSPVDAHQSNSGDAASEASIARDTAPGDVVVVVDATADVPATQDMAGDEAADSRHAADTSTDGAHKGDSL